MMHQRYLNMHQRYLNVSTWLLPKLVAVGNSNSQTKQRFTYNDPCVERGATVAYDEQAHKSSLQAVEEILRDNLKLN